MAILEGNSIKIIIDTLYSQITLLEKDLGRDNNALNWFNLYTTATSSASLQLEIPSTSLAGMYVGFTILIYYLTRIK